MLSAKPWAPDAVLRFLLGLMASILFGMMVVQWLFKAEPVTGETQFVRFIVGTVTFHGVALILAHLLLKEHQLSWVSGFGLGSPRLGRSLLLAVVVGVVVLPIAWSLSQLSVKLLKLFEMQAELQQTVQTLQTTVGLPEKIYFGVVAILVAPIAEEVVFRGILYPAVKQRGYPQLALWGTSLLFAATHANLMTFIPLTFLALVLTMLYETTDNLLAPILTHSLFNAANFFWLLTMVQPVE